MKAITPVLLICLVLTTTLTADATASTAPADRIVEVTVFPDRAEVVRELRVDLARGRTVIEFANLPLNIERDSLRVTALGVDATLGIIELRESARAPVETPEMMAATEQVEHLESAMAALAAEDETDVELRAFLAALKATTTTRESKRLGEGDADPEALKQTYGFVQSALGDLGHRKLSRVEKRRELERALSLAHARLAVLKPEGPIRVRTATVEVTADAPGALSVRLAYLAPGASWRPAYRASLDAAAGEVSLETEALVRQNTGEDWNGVSLRLSTAAPARGVRPPVLESWLLRPIEILPQSIPGGFLSKIASDTIEDLEIMTSGVDAMPRAPKEEALHQRVASRQTATPVQSAYNLVFQVPGQSGIPADNADHLVALSRDLLRGEVEYQVVPMLSESAFLVVNTKAPLSHPLLAGPIRVFSGFAYLGAAEMLETGPGGELSLPFGSDNRLHVKRTQLPRERRDAGVTGRDRRIAYAYRTTIENLLDRAVNVVLEERVPVSEDARIDVENGKSTTPGSTSVRERPGVMQWRMKLEPGGTQEFAVDYAVRYPGDIVIAGLR